MKFDICDHRLKLFALVVTLLAFSLTAQAQQCTLPSQIYLPKPDKDRYEGFGSAISTDHNYMVVGIPQNSASQAIGGVAFVYKLDEFNQWEKIAELRPSDLGKYTMFGRRVAISGNFIIVSGNDYTDQGANRGKLYVFEKPLDGEWTSTTENYFIAKPFLTETTAIEFDQFSIRGNELVARTVTYGFEALEVYRRTDGIFELRQTIQMPGGSGFPDWNLAMGDSFFALGSDQYSNADLSTGAVFLYQKNGDDYNPNPVIVKAAEQSASEWRAFGFNIAIHNSTLFVQGMKYDGGNYNQIFYIIEKPQDGWVNASYPVTLEETGFAYSSVQIAANENYLIASDENLKSVVGFKKTSGAWDSNALRFTLNDIDNSGFTFGRQLQLTDKHLVIGCPNWLISDSREVETIFDIYRENGDFENADISQATPLATGSVNATDDFFGESIGVHNGQLAVTAGGDDEKGWSAGVVYLFDIARPNTEPVQKIHCPEEEYGSGFGERIAMGDSLMFIAAPYMDSISSNGSVAFHNMGKVYVYRQNSSGLWTYSSQIVAPTIYKEMYFGKNVVTAPGYCAISEFNGGNSDNTGKVHIFRESKTNGKFEYVTTLGVWTFGMGHSMVMTDSVLVVGTSGSPSPAHGSTVFVFQRKGEWKTSTGYATLTIDAPGWVDGFGSSVSIFGDIVVVGAPRWPGFETRPIPRDYLIPGAAFMYKKPASGWAGNLKPFATITPRDPTDFGAFGAKVAIDHNDLFIGSPNVYAQYNYSQNFTNNDGALIPGKVYHFTRPADGWKTTNQETRQIQSFEPEIVDGYGSELYISDRYLYVGAMLDDTPSGVRTGSVQTMMQLPVIDELNTMCIDETPVMLKGYPKGGQFSGPGVNAATGVFSPAVAGPGIHNVRYVRDGCEAVIQVSVLPDVMVVTHQSDAIQTKCRGQKIPIAFESDEGNENYMWYYRTSMDDQFVKYDSMKEVIAGNAAGFYRVVVSRGSCSSRIAEFEILEDPEILISIASVPTICSEDEFALSFTPQNGTWTGQGITADGVFDPMQTGNGSYKQIYTVTTPAGCVWKDSITLHVDLAPKPDLQYAGEPICGDDHVSLRLNGVDDGATVTWFKNGVANNSSDMKVLDVFEDGHYYATVQKGTCVLSTREVFVPKEVIDITFNIPVLCADEVVMLDVIPQGGLWQGEVVTETGQFDASLVPDGNYPVQYDLHTAVGCHWQRSIEVVVDKLKEPVLASDAEIVCRNEPATMSLINVDDRSAIVWHNEGNPDFQGDANSNISVEQPGIYWATVLKSNCVVSTEKLTLVAKPDSLFVPNVFTPNSDNANDYFEVRTEGMNDFHLSLFNRYGGGIYETDNIDFTWTGDDASTGVYFWRVTYLSCAETREEQKGWLHILK